MERFRNRLRIWKRKRLTKGGKVVLVKSTLSSLLLYLLSLFIIPVAIANRIEEIIRNFLWGTTKEVWRYHLLSWDQICLPKEWGGLGIRRIKIMNQALLSKWLWRFTEDDGSLWQRVIGEKYGRGSWGRIKVLPTHSVSLWKGIETLRVCDLQYVPQGGHREHHPFLDRQWWEDKQLRHLLPIIYNRAIYKDSTTAQNSAV